MKTLKELLKEFDACSPARDWAGDKTIEQVVKECNKGEWLLEMAKRFELPERKIIACSGHCANTVRHLIKDENSIQLLDMCMSFEDERISFEELGKARQAADTVVACAAVYFAAAAEDAVCAARYAARVAVREAGDSFATRAAARKENELQTANIVRERLGQDIINICNKVNELLNN